MGGRGGATEPGCNLNVGFLSFTRLPTISGGALKGEGAQSPACRTNGSVSFTGVLFVAGAISQPIFRIVLRLVQASRGIFVPPGHALRVHLDIPFCEPGLLSAALDLMIPARAF